MAADLKTSPIIINWRNLIYEVSSLEWKAVYKLPERINRVILNNLNGSFRTGEMTAVLGPSGSGKTTLFECLLGRRRNGTEGVIQVTSGYGESSGDLVPKTFSVAFVPQRESVLLRFTVKEALLYASRLKNHSAKGGEAAHAMIVADVATRLRLTEALGQRVERCSTGQKKLLSVAQELLSRPRILIIDEPTSNLDSTTAGSVLKVLKELTRPMSGSARSSMVSDLLQEPVAILASIHQPSSKIFLLFDKIYCISSTGRCMYEGSPQRVLPTLNSIGLECPPYYNVAEYLLEVASGELGQEKLASLYEVHSRAWSQVPFDGKKSESMSSADNPLVRSVRKARHPAFWHTWVIWRRSVRFTWRDPLLMGLRLGSYVGIALFMSFLHTNPIGVSNGCPHILAAPIKWSMFDLMDLVVKAGDIVRETKELLANAAMTFLHITIITLSVLSVTVMSFPLEVPALRTELMNGWYSSGTYLVGRTLAELPFQFAFTFVYVATTYWFTHQIREAWRFITVSLIFILCSFVAQGYAQVVGALFLKNIAHAVFGTSLSIIPQVVFGAFLIKSSDMRGFYQPLNYLSFFRYTFKSIITLTYGYGRCECVDPRVTSGNETINGMVIDCTEDCMDKFSGGMTQMMIGRGGMKTFVSKMSLGSNPLFVESCNVTNYRPAPMSHFNSDESDLWLYITALCVYWLIMRIVGYVLLMWRLKSYRG